MQFRLLGSVEVLGDDGTPVALPGARARAILAMLLVSRPDVVSSGRLFATGQSAKDPVNALHVQIAKLRAALPEPRLVSERGGYRLLTRDGEVDADVFAEACATGHELARQGDPAGAVTVLREALARWRQPVGYDFADVWRARLQELRLAALDTVLDAELTLGRHRELVPELAGLVAAHPLRERFAELLMRALHRGGRRPEALAVFDDLRRRLADELGTDPGPGTAALHLAILRDEAGAPGGNLPHPVGILFGRDADLGGAERLLAERRLVTLTGPGGVGKTRAARELGHRLRGRFPDGVWLAELASVARDGSVLDALAATLLDGEPAAPARDRLLAHLRDREVLLVLDNCEHVVEDAAAAAELLLGQCPRLTVLATSREPLNIEGERPVPLAPLALPDAIRLFRDRAPGVRDGDAAVGRLCARLDALPLVLELAAAGTRLFSLGEIEARLDDLANASRRAPARHHSVRALLDWSHALLSEAERRVFAGLSVFRDGCTFADAERVCGATAGVLAALVDKSLVVAGHDGRFRLLETVRGYAASTTDTTVFHDRHAEVRIAFGREVYAGLSSPRQQELPARFLAELPNVRAVTTWLLRRGDGPRALVLQGLLGYLWYVCGREAEGARWLGRAIGCFDAGPRSGCDGPLAVALAWHSYLGWASGVLPDPWAPAERVRALYRTTTDRDGVRIALPAVAAVAVQLRPGAEARACLDEAEEVMAEFDHPWLRAILDAVWSEQHRREGDLAAAVAAAEANLRYFEGIDDRFGVVFSHLRLGDAEEQAGHRARARARWARAREVARAGQAPVKRGYAELRLAYLDLDDDLPAAVAALDRIRAEAAALAAADLGAAAANLLGLAHVRRRDETGAVTCFLEAVAAERALPIRTAVAAAHLTALAGPRWKPQAEEAVGRIPDPLHRAALGVLLGQLTGVDDLGRPLPGGPVCTPLAALV
ncbi:AfsR/SARP family transcriptional regulator [Amycolatopsis sp. Hca4]|uniref:AfsR/SARP family transcriptional regulator n=1 Tax=Amycolatopsis sp. Hca4 TaxID=2742131 RepID=UPI0015913195|nr:AfsR/SARP family transcriptional regulator [Amycolatopsis sp. Hca4]QKV80248.1 AfsR/SARP family transcriptional regulator [Amycolatopsis sp. Hca4]